MYLSMNEPRYFGPRKATGWERQLGAEAGAFNDESMGSQVGGTGGIASRVPGARQEQNTFRQAAPPRLPEVFQVDEWGNLRGNYDFLMIARYSLKDKTPEIGRFGTFLNPKKMR